MYTPVYRRLDVLRSLGTKGHRKGSHQGLSLPGANTRTNAPAEARGRLVLAEDKKMLAEQALGEGSDARRHVSLMLVFGA